MKNLIVIISLLLSTSAFSFPSNTRLGYSSCSSCHISPTGGGILTSYGRDTAADILSTFSDKKEAQPLHGALDPYLPMERTIIKEDLSLLIGGDFRYIVTNKNNFWMQRDVELAVSLNKTVTLAVSAGYYLNEIESRRSYLLVNLNENLSVRLGKFFPAYGILFDDHTVATRRGLGWDQGQESYNVEFAYKNQLGEIFITPTVGTSPVLDMGSRKGYTIRTNETGIATRLAGYVGEKSQVGVSSYYLVNQDLENPSVNLYYGAYGLLGLTEDIYLLTEFDIANQQDIFSTNQLGWEILKGLHLVGSYQRRTTINEWEAKAQWFPRPHLEVSLAYNYTDIRTSTVMMLHYYL